MQNKSIHTTELERLQKQISDYARQQDPQKQLSPIALQYPSGNSNTTRSKSYKSGCHQIDCGPLNQVLLIDPQNRIARVQPRITMENLVSAVQPYGLTVPVVPEFKGITVGGAVLGAAAESSSHQWGIFNDICTGFEIICGDGTLLKVSPSNHPEIFYGIPGSYGSLGMLVSVEIKLVPARESIRLQYTTFSKPREAVEALREISHSINPPDFLDGLVFTKDQAVIIEGHWESPTALKESLPQYSLGSKHSPWYYHHAKTIALENPSKTYQELMNFQEYLFRYDHGAFWMGAYLTHLPILSRFIRQGVLKKADPSQKYFNATEISNFHRISHPNIFWRTALHSCMDSQSLWGFLHRAEKWVQDRFIIQDCCIPEENASRFLEKILEDPGAFPLWLCPILGTREPQLLAPHLLNDRISHSHFINIGIYGLPSYSASMETITRKLEHLTHEHGGRKVLYSRSYYTQDEFWKVYPYDAYSALRKRTRAEGIWRGITEKVLSE